MTISICGQGTAQCSTDYQLRQRTTNLRQKKKKRKRKKLPTKFNDWLIFAVRRPLHSYFCEKMGRSMRKLESASSLATFDETVQQEIDTMW
jgi:hypothetical protein